ncbi:MAG: MoaD/ThiS family protein [Candidatus Eremiobacteraeota bacterium]|nr:MoaD/ThiS family protein [Candidatus Eremiobacteraeota bacterium]
MMRVNVRLFASQREAVGRSHVQAEVRDGATAAQLFSQLCAAHPRLRETPNTVFAVNREQASPQTTLHDGDEVALLPPVAGG